MVHISEYESALCKEPCITSQILEASGTSKPFSKNTWFIKLRTDTSCKIGFGDDPKPDIPLSAGIMEVFPVQPGHKVAVLLDSTPFGGSMFDLLAVIADPKKAKARLEDLKAAGEYHHVALSTLQGISDDITARSASLEKQSKELEDALARIEAEKAKVQAASDMLKSQSAEFEHKVSAWNAKRDAEVADLYMQRESAAEALHASQADLDRQKSDFNSRVHDTMTSLEAYKATLKDREASTQAREEQVAKAEEALKTKHARLKELAGVLA